MKKQKIKPKEKVYMDNSKFIQVFGYKIIIYRKVIISIIAIIVVIAIVLGIALQRNKEIEKEIRINQAIQIFIKIDNLAHQQFADMQARGNPSGFRGFETFKNIDDNFHNAKTIREKYKRAKEMSKFFEGMDEFLHKNGGLTSTDDKLRDKQYHELNNSLHQLEQKTTIKEIKEIQALEIFAEIDELAEKIYNEISQNKGDTTIKTDKVFSMLDKAYHDAQTFNQKFRAAELFLEYIKERHIIAKNLGYTTTEEDNKFYELVYVFDQMKNQ